MIAALILKAKAFAAFVLLFATVNSWMDHDQPGRSHVDLAAKIARVAFIATIADSPIFTAAALTATVKGESSFGARRHGHNDYGVAQIHARPDLEHDDEANLVEASRQIRISLEMCGDFRAYFSGRCSKDPHVKWLSDRRMQDTRGYLRMFEAADLSGAEAKR